jgi:hypothetical protein
MLGPGERPDVGKLLKGVDVVPDEHLPPMFGPAGA